MAAPALLVLSAAFIVALGLAGGLQFLIDFGQPPPWVQQAFSVWYVLVGLWALAAVLLVAALAALQYALGSRRMVIAQLAAVVLAVTGTLALSYRASSWLVVAVFGAPLLLGIYLVLVNVAAIRLKQFGDGLAWVGIVAAVFFMGAGLLGPNGWAMVFPGLALYALWSALLGFSLLASRRRRPAPVQPALQTPPADR